MLLLLWWEATTRRLLNVRGDVLIARAWVAIVSTRAAAVSVGAGPLSGRGNWGGALAGLLAYTRVVRAVELGRAKTLAACSCHNRLL